MGLAAIFVRVVLSTVFAFAGIVKLSNLERSRKAVLDFGLPDWAAQPLGLLLPLAELLTAILLIPSRTVLWGGICSIVLLAAFIIAIAINLSLGRKPECNCFGQVHSEPIGWSTLARNAGLMAAASFVLWDDRYQPPASLAGSLARLSPLAFASIAGALLTFVFASAMTWLAFHLLRQNGRLLLRMDALEDQLNGGQPAAQTAKPRVGPPLGSPAPQFVLPNLQDGSLVTLHSLLGAKKPVALIFSDPSCGPCTELLPQIARWERDYADTLTIALVSRGKPEANKEKLAPHSLRHVLLQKDREVAASFQANGTPAAILISADGTVTSELAMGGPAIVTLIAIGSSKLPALPSAQGGLANGNALLPGTPRQSPSLLLGTPAPVIELPDLDGNVVGLSRSEGADTLLLFWNPSCGFCARMLPELKNWELNRPQESPRLLVVSTGSAESNRAMGLESLVLLDQTFATGRAFQVRGTPSAILLDGQGRIASGVMVGAPVILNSLANNLRSPALR